MDDTVTSSNGYEPDKTESRPVNSHRSRYRMHPITLAIGPDRIIYYMPSHFQLPQSWSVMPGGTLYLPGVDEASAHTLIHYLYTGEYEPFVDDHDFNFCPKPAFDQALSVLIVAEDFELPGLAQKSMEQIKRYGDNMSMIEVLEASKRWATETNGFEVFANYFIMLLRANLKKDHMTFDNEALIKCLSDGKTSELATRVTVRLLTERLGEVLGQNEETKEKLHQALDENEQLKKSLHSLEDSPKEPPKTTPELQFPAAPSIAESAISDAVMVEVESCHTCSVSYCSNSSGMTEAIEGPYEDVKEDVTEEVPMTLNQPFESDYEECEKELEEGNEEPKEQPKEVPYEKRFEEQKEEPKEELCGERNEELNGNLKEEPHEAQKEALGELYVTHPNPSVQKLTKKKKKKHFRRALQERREAQRLAQQIEGEQRACADRVKHIEGNGWEACAACQKFLQRAALLLGQGSV